MWHPVPGVKVKLELMGYRHGRGFPGSLPDLFFCMDDAWPAVPYFGEVRAPVAGAFGLRMELRDPKDSLASMFMVFVSVCRQFPFPVAVC